MLPLCDALHINVNELLSGARLSDADYKKKSRGKYHGPDKRKRRIAKKKIILSVIIGLITLLASVTLFIISGVLEMEEWLRVLLIVIGLVVLIGGIAVAVEVQAVIC